MINSPSIAAAHSSAAFRARYADHQACHRSNQSYSALPRAWAVTFLGGATSSRPSGASKNRHNHCGQPVTGSGHIIAGPSRVAEPDRKADVSQAVTRHARWARRACLVTAARQRPAGHRSRTPHAASPVPTAPLGCPRRGPHAALKAAGTITTPAGDPRPFISPGRERGDLDDGAVPHLALGSLCGVNTGAQRARIWAAAGDLRHQGLRGRWGRTASGERQDSRERSDRQ
jgi:hypothetical protein